MKLYQLTCTLTKDGLNISQIEYDAVEHEKIITFKIGQIRKQRIGVVGDRSDPIESGRFEKIAWCYEEDLQATRDFLRNSVLVHAESFTKNILEQFKLIAQALNNAVRNEPHRT